MKHRVGFYPGVDPRHLAVQPAPTVDMNYQLNKYPYTIKVNGENTRFLEYVSSMLIEPFEVPRFDRCVYDRDEDRVRHKRIKMPKSPSREEVTEARDYLETVVCTHDALVHLTVCYNVGLSEKHLMPPNQPYLDEASIFLYKNSMNKPMNPNLQKAWHKPPEIYHLAPQEQAPTTAVLGPLKFFTRAQVNEFCRLCRYELSITSCNEEAQAKVLEIKAREEYNRIMKIYISKKNSSWHPFRSRELVGLLWRKRLVRAKFYMQICFLRNCSSSMDGWSEPHEEQSLFMNPASSYGHIMQFLHDENVWQMQQWQYYTAYTKGSLDAGEAGDPWERCRPMVEKIGTVS